jgi:hypothetical protein
MFEGVAYQFRVPCSATVWLTVPLVANPTAQQSDLVAQATELRGVLGVLTMDQVLWCQCSMLLAPAPTAQQFDRVIHVTPESVLAPRGVATMDQAVPFQCSARV